MTEQKSIIQQAWEQLDVEVDEIVALTMQARSDYQSVLSAKIETAKARARGKAEVLALMTTPFFKTADEIAAEAQERWAARQRGEVRQTPGLSVVWQPGQGFPSPS